MDFESNSTKRMKNDPAFQTVCQAHWVLVCVLQNYNTSPPFLAVLPLCGLCVLRFQKWLSNLVGRIEQDRKPIHNAAKVRTYSRHDHPSIHNSMSGVLYLLLASCCTLFHASMHFLLPLYSHTTIYSMAEREPEKFWPVHVLGLVQWNYNEDCICLVPCVVPCDMTYPLIPARSKTIQRNLLQCEEAKRLPACPKGRWTWDIGRAW